MTPPQSADDDLLQFDDDEQGSVIESACSYTKTTTSQS